MENMKMWYVQLVWSILTFIRAQYVLQMRWWTIGWKYRYGALQLKIGQFYCMLAKNTAPYSAKGYLDSEGFLFF